MKSHRNAIPFVWKMSDSRVDRFHPDIPSSGAVCMFMSAFIAAMLAEGRNSIVDKSRLEYYCPKCDLDGPLNVEIREATDREEGRAKTTC